ncbi:hypothetical protein SCLARK_00636 [Spiroplasma clarkii]|uniref:ATPase AAA-type core domain-containing protein n=1 Tax=Spiroplasma clarkii TaxID=2139 RepID=A0A1Y0L001_9MOLU|nr:AAA family ATPase [Spiroplasma clarkii]ARU91303.1 hypothetical protein SCLARK_00636 [Spiroplasma clarkii]ATX70733.1 hypothetical protein SCLAR_v1c04050 [Spiroplasma clarkii]
MKTIIKSLKFSGYKAFEDEVFINFETNKKKYNFNDSVIELVRDEKNLYFNNHLGFIGPNAAGKTSILTVFRIYRVFLSSGVRTFGEGILDPLTGVVDRNFSILNPEDINKNKDYLEITVELVTEEILVKHNLKIKRDFTFFEKIDVHIKKNKNYTWENIFEKNFEDKIDFITYSKYTRFENKRHFIAKEQRESLEIIKKTANIIDSIASSIMTISSETTKMNWTGDLNRLLLRNHHNDEAIKKIQDFLGTIAKSVDPQIAGAQIQKVMINDMPTFNFSFILKNEDKAAWSALSVGTWKIIGIFMKLYLLKQINAKNVYVLIDEIDNSWHPNLTKIFLRLVKSKMFASTTFLFTFHNPYIASEIRHDALYIVSENQEVVNWPEKIKEFSENGAPRLSTKFEIKYLDEVVCSGPENFKAEEIYDFFGE